MSKKTIFTAIIMILCILKMKSVMTGISQAINICATSIIPSIFIFMVFADILTSTIFDNCNFILPIKFFVFALGTLCGFPIGATACDSLCKNKVISKDDAKKLIPFCNNASPGFVLGAVGTTFFANKKIGYIILIAQIISSLLPMMFIRINYKPQTFVSIRESTSDLFCHALEKAAFGMLKICASVCFFSAIIEVLKDFSIDFASVFLEISNGTVFCADLFDINPYLSVATCGFCCGFSGICVLSQIVSVTKNVRIPFFNLLIKKLFQGLLCSIFSLAAYYLFFDLQNVSACVTMLVSKTEVKP